MLDFLIPFITIGLAELGDKTQLGIIALAPKTKHHSALFWGIMLAFLLTDGISIFLGDILTNYVDPTTIKIIGGILFLIFGIMLLRKRKVENENVHLNSPFMTGFGLILISEMGDKTQIASGLFATQYDPLIVLTSVMLVLGMLTLLALEFGKWIGKKTSRTNLNKISALLFICMGVASLISSGLFS